MRILTGLEPSPFFQFCSTILRQKSSQGGYVGVDIFFVISGFLITSILVREIDAGSFSFAKFYARRIRRLLPALFFMLTVSSACAVVLMVPEDLRAFGRSLVATTLFSANILFWRESGYFDAAADMKPLLHMWSLGIEEQFYIVLPIVLVIVVRFWRSTLPKVLASLFLVSFALSVWAVRSVPEAAFYVLPTRAWELLAGSLLAVGVVPAITDRRWATAISCAGLALVLLAILSYQPGTRFPGEAALLPVAGVALLIYAAPGTPIGGMLSSVPFVRIGQLSYSLYLWHWPLLVFAGYANIEPLSTMQLVGVAAATFLASYLSWRFIEQPFRHGNTANLKLFVCTGGVMTTFVAVGALVYVLQGLPARLPASPYKSREMLGAYLKQSPCFVVPYGIWNETACTGSSGGEERRLLIIGDSYGAQFGDFLRKHYPGSVTEYTTSSCPPIFDYDHAIRPEQCREINDRRKKLISGGVFRHPCCSLVGPAEQSRAFTALA